MGGRGTLTPDPALDNAHPTSAANGIDEAEAERPGSAKARPSKPAPLLAVCSLCGGAGASTLAYLVARSATARCERPILLCDAGGPTGGLSLYARAEAPNSLAGLANLLAADGVPDGGLFADARSGLRVLAGAPDLEAGADPRGLARLLGDARHTHDLTVVDCGTLRGTAERQAMQMASHIAWVLPATLSGTRRARRVLELVPLDSSRPEVVVARRDGGGRQRPTDELAALAALRSAPLVLMPHVPDLGESEPDQAEEQAEVTLEAIWTVVRR